MVYEQEILRTMTEESRCPVCATVEDKEFELMAELQNEVINAEGTRSAIAREGGFCHDHFRQFLRMATADTSALLLQTMIEEYSRGSVPERISCRVCGLLTAYEEAIQSDFAALLTTDAFRASYAKGTGLCLPHRRIIGLDPRLTDLNPWLDAIQRQQTLNLLPQLTLLSTHRYFETTRSQRRSIPRVAEKFAGRKAVGS